MGGVLVDVPEDLFTDAHVRLPAEEARVPVDSSVEVRHRDAGDDRYFSRELRHLLLPPLRIRSTFKHLRLKRETDVRRRGGGPI
jgi:hypothetical protein